MTTHKLVFCTDTFQYTFHRALDCGGVFDIIPKGSSNTHLSPISWASRKDGSLRPIMVID